MDGDQVQNINICIDQSTIFGPLTAALLVNALYSALMIKKQAGADITPQVEFEVLADVIALWSRIQSSLIKSALDLSEKSQDQ